MGKQTAVPDIIMARLAAEGKRLLADLEQTKPDPNQPGVVAYYALTRAILRAQIEGCEADAQGDDVGAEKGFTEVIRLWQKRDRLVDALLLPD